MKKINAPRFRRVMLIIAVAMVGTPLAGHAAPEVVAWGWNVFGQTNVLSGLSNVVGIAAGGSHSLALLRQLTTAPTPHLELARGLSGLELQA
jgi:hypothetical protein